MVSFSLRLGAFGFRGRGPRSLPGEPLCLQTLTVVREGLLRDLVLSQCLLGIDLAKCLTRIALGFGGRLWWLKPARRLCHFFAFSPISTRRRNASERVVSFAAAQASTSAISAAGILDVTCGSRPVAGRPRLFFGVTFIDFFIIFG